MSKTVLFQIACAPLLATLVLPSLTHAGAINPFNPVIARVQLSTDSGLRGLPVFLDEYDGVTGSLVQSIAVPTSGGSALVLDSSITEGMLNTTVDGTKIIFAGYRKNAFTPGAPALSTTAATPGAPRVIGSVAVSTGTVDTSFTTGNWALGSIRAVASVDGSSYYAATGSSNQGVSYIPSSGATPVQIANPNRNTRFVTLANFGAQTNTLVAGDGATGDRIYTYGSLPTTSLAASPLFTGLSVDNTAVQGMKFFDLDPAIPGDDAVYFVQTGQPTLGGGLNRGVQKWVIDPNTSTWVAKGFVATVADVDALDVSGYVDGSDVTLFVSGSTKLYKFVDTTGPTGSIGGSLSDYVLTTVGSGFQYRGVAVAVPEPTSLAFLGAGALGLLSRRRRS
jgi:hypothetical protein